MRSGRPKRQRLERKTEEDEFGWILAWLTTRRNTGSTWTKWPKRTTGSIPLRRTDAKAPFRHCERPGGKGPQEAAGRLGTTCSSVDDSRRLLCEGSNNQCFSNLQDSGV